MLALYRKIWSVTGPAQIVLIVLSVLVAALAAAPLHYQKEIVNGLAGTMNRQQLLLLCAQFLGVLVVSSGLKFALGYRSAVLGEGVIRRIRVRILGECAKGAGTEGDQRIPSGTLVTMISVEAEEVGKFVGEAIATPLLQVGVLISVVAFIASTQPLLGLIVAGVVLPQAAIVLAVQKRINTKVGERVKLLRGASDRIVAADLSRAEDEVHADFDRIFEARRSIALFKLSSKFALNAVAGLGTAGVLLLGGWLVLGERTDIGTVVAALTGMARISQPWRELVAFYRNLSAVRVKYELLVAALRE
jgi:ABC-type multidrug transport system fused ATPase/permease subunit